LSAPSSIHVRLLEPAAASGAWLEEWLTRIEREVGIGLSTRGPAARDNSVGEIVVLGKSAGRESDLPPVARPRVWVDLADARRPAGVAAEGGRLIRGRGIEGIRWAAKHLQCLAAWEPKLVVYGPSADQFAFVRIPREAQPPHPVAVLIHGGFWRERWTLDTIEPLAVDLARLGFATWNLEYRRVGPSGGGWPRTQEDVAAALERLAQEPGDLVDLSRVVLVGHSAGGQLALAAAASGSFRPRLVVSLAGVLDLALCADRGLGDRGNAVVDFLGSYPDEPNDEYARASPIELVPIDVQQVIAQGLADSPDLVEMSRRYVERCEATGRPVEYLESGGDHFALVDPATDDWQSIVQRIVAIVG
jgi:acetyl esterase/lipase